MRVKVSFIFALLLLVIILSAEADIIRMKDGRIFIGRVYTIARDGVVLLVSGEKLTVQYDEILQADPDFSNLSDRVMEITLKDDSTMRGKIRNYDSDIGLLVEIDLGVITVTPENIKSIMDYTQRSKQRAQTVNIGVLGGYYFMVGDLSGAFSGNFSTRIFGEFNLGFIIEGLFTGIVISYQPLIPVNYDVHSYYLFDFDIYLMYRFLLLRSSPGILRNFVPFISIGAGAALPVRTGNGETGTELDFAFSGSVGLDYFITDDFLIRLYGSWMTVLQSELFFNSISVNVGAAYCF